MYTDISNMAFSMLNLLKNKHSIRSKGLSQQNDSKPLFPMENLNTNQIYKRQTIIAFINKKIILFINTLKLP
ncbi:MAG: hypothetical protein QXK76_01295 [Candidatus Woesearchaeota archaeon]